jgi:transcriptional regulator with XRE-family HTH domain
MGGSDVSTVLRDLGRRVAELRAGRGMTQDQLSAKLDVYVQYLQRVERGVENLTVASLVRVADALEAHVADLFAVPATRTVRPGRPRKLPRGPDEAVSTSRKIPQSLRAKSTPAPRGAALTLVSKRSGRRS